MEVHESGNGVWSEGAMKSKAEKFVVAFIVLASDVWGYEINNHADMSQSSAQISVLNDLSTSGKLARLGLRVLPLADPRQRFPLDAGLGPIPYCFGSERPADWAVTIPYGSSNYPTTQRDSGVAQPDWPALGGTLLSIAQFIRYGACYEDEEHPAKSVSHFYNPQAGGEGSNVLGVPIGPNSLEWMLKRDAGPTTFTGVNHYTWMDARNNFYYALTGRDLDPQWPITGDVRREAAWGRTFQALGHIVHHLQDMGSPQHVRSDFHCNSVPECRESWKAKLGAYRPSGYETYFDQQFDVVKALAQTATAPIVFGLPREFWNTRTNTDLSTPSVSGHLSPIDGLAAYTSTNFTSAGTDFRGFNLSTGSPQFAPGFRMAFPQPSGSFNDVNVADLFNPVNLPAVRDAVCGGTTTNCVMRFMGTVADPNARTSALSTFSRELLVPRDPNDATVATWTGTGTFQQNFFTYSDAVQKLVPTAVSYSAGLINYFFRGELEISLPDEGVYGIVDHSVEKDKGVHGFRFIKMKVKNTTPDINSARGTIAQNMTNGQFFAVAKFHRNTCYTPTLTGQIGTIGRGANPSVNFWSSCRGPVEEIVVSEPEPGVSDLPANGAAVPMAFDFLTPIPIEATDLSIQVVFKGTLGEEPSAVAVTTKSISEPSFLTNLDASDMIACGTNEPTICRRVDDVNAPVFFRDEAASLLAAQSLPPSQSSKFGFNRWLGFNPAQPRSKVVEWHVARTDLPNPPQFKVDRGTFRRIAVLADIDIPTRVVNWGSSSETVVTNVDQDDVPVTLGLFNTGNFYGPTTESLIPAVERFATTRIKESADGSAPTDLPKYAVIRGVVVGVRKTRSSAPDWLPTLLYSNGENVAAASYGDAVKHPPNTTVHERGPALPETAIRSVGDIKFSRGPAYSLPEYTEFDLSMMRDDADGERARKYQPRFVRGLEYPGGYYWTFQ